MTVRDLNFSSGPNESRKAVFRLGMSRRDSLPFVVRFQQRAGIPFAAGYAFVGMPFRLFESYRREHPAERNK